MTNPYEQLRAEINKRFPERLKIEEGTEVRISDLMGDEQKVVCTDRDQITIHYLYPKSKDSMLLSVYKDTIDKDEILGKPLELRDVLRALPPEYAISHDGTLWKNQEDDVFGGDSLTEITEFNLALPLSHPDNSEACEKLLAVLTNKGI